MSPAEPTDIVAIVEAQIADWQARRVSIADAALSLGRLPPHNWSGLKLIVAEELFLAEVRLEKCKTPSKK